MTGRRLRLKFEEKGAGLVAGAAWITAAGIEITPDCAAYAELDYHLRDLEADIVEIRKAAKKKFKHYQGPI